MDQINGKRPTGIILSPEEAPKMMEFRVTHDAHDPSRVPQFTRKLNRIRDREIVATREWVFDNQNGMWTINGKPFDPNRIDAVVKEDTAERWIFINAANDWEHPVHVHLEEHHIVHRNGNRPPTNERGRKDVTVIGPSEIVEMVVRFRDFVGIYPIHCHNTVHEDHAMMAMWKVEVNEDKEKERDKDREKNRDRDKKKTKEQRKR
jgi:FtsP/CotA-like multicopper oxidase with cupredoxin domain